MSGAVTFAVIAVALTFLLPLTYKLLGIIWHAGLRFGDWLVAAVERRR